MKIFLDDRRRPPDGFEYVQSVKSAWMLVDMFRRDIEILSIDYDLGEGETTMELLELMAEKGCQLKHINIHSTHDQGVLALRKFCQQHFPQTKVTLNKLD